VVKAMLGDQPLPLTGSAKPADASSSAAPPA
jgi:hypothetical protein